MRIPEGRQWFASTKERRREAEESETLRIGRFPLNLQILTRVCPELNVLNATMLQYFVLPVEGHFINLSLLKGLKQVELLTG